MRTFITALALIGMGVSVALTLNLYVGMSGDMFGDGAGTAVLGAQLWGGVGALAAIIFGFLGRFMDREKPRPARRLYNVCIAAGLLCGLLILAMPFVFV